MYDSVNLHIIYAKPTSIKHFAIFPRRQPEEQPELAALNAASHLGMCKLHVINPYEEADPLNLPPPDSDTESKDTAVAPTPDNHEQEAKADTVGTITRDFGCLSLEKNKHHHNPETVVRFEDSVAPTPIPPVSCSDLRDEGDDAATTSNPQPSQPPGSPRYHL
ncbi:hypothetical protein Tco_1108930 [Tanacetum coccineum]